MKSVNEKESGYSLVESLVSIFIVMITFLLASKLSINLVKLNKIKVKEAKALTFIERKIFDLKKQRYKNLNDGIYKEDYGDFTLQWKITKEFPIANTGLIDVTANLKSKIANNEKKIGISTIIGN